MSALDPYQTVRVHVNSAKEATQNVKSAPLRKRAFSGSAESPSQIIDLAAIAESIAVPKKPLPLTPDEKALEAQKALSRKAIADTFRVTRDKVTQNKATQDKGKAHRDSMNCKGQGSLRITAKEARVYKETYFVPPIEELEKNPDAITDKRIPHIHPKQRALLKDMLKPPLVEELEKKPEAITAKSIPHIHPQNRALLKDRLTETIKGSKLVNSEMRRICAADALLRIEAYEDKINEERLPLATAQDKDQLLEERIRADNAIKRIEAYEEKIKEERLLLAITQDKVGLWQGLFLDNESIIKTEQLFACISEWVKEHKTDKFSHVKLSTLLLFCETWVKQNEKTLLIAKAKPKIEEIIEATKDHQYTGIRNRSQYLKETMDRIVASPEDDILKVGLKPDARDMVNVLERLKASKNVAKHAKRVAKDLSNFMIALFNKLTPSHFIKKKWSGEDAPLFMQYVTYFNGVSNFIIDSILSEPDAEKRALVMMFYLEVAFQCLDEGEFSTPFAIQCGLGRGCISQLSKSWKVIMDSSRFKGMKEELESLYLPMGAFRALKHKMAKYERIVPYMGLIKGELENGGEMPPVLGKEPQDLRYNVDKLKMLNKAVAEKLGFQEKWKERNGWQTYRYQTKIVEAVLNQPSISDESGNQRADKLEPRQRKEKDVFKG